MARILIVDDDTLSTQLYVNKLTSEGHVVLSLADGKEAMNYCSQAFDIILLDVMIPQVDGITLLGEFRRNEANTKTPIIIYTNLLGDDIIQKSRQAGANECIHKIDYTPEQLIEKIKSYIAPAVNPSS